MSLVVVDAIARRLASHPDHEKNSSLKQRKNSINSRELTTFQTPSATWQSITPNKLDNAPNTANEARRFQVPFAIPCATYADASTLPNFAGKLIVYALKAQMVSHVVKKPTEANTRNKIMAKRLFGTTPSSFRRWFRMWRLRFFLRRIGHSIRQLQHFGKLMLRHVSSMIS